MVRVRGLGFGVWGLGIREPGPGFKCVAGFKFQGFPTVPDDFKFHGMRVSRIRFSLETVGYQITENLKLSGIN